MNVLFICSRNQWRSPTGEEIYKNHSFIIAKSAGTEPSARIKLTAKQIAWADIIFVMEKKHKQRMLEKFSFETEDKQIVILDIADEYKFMDSELIAEIETKVNQYI
jgi:predicted protein tyrosine phosphatase